RGDACALPPTTFPCLVNPPELVEVIQDVSGPCFFVGHPHAELFANGRCGSQPRKVSRTSCRRRVRLTLWTIAIYRHALGYASRALRMNSRGLVNGSMPAKMPSLPARP